MSSIPDIQVPTPDKVRARIASIKTEQTTKLLLNCASALETATRLPTTVRIDPDVTEGVVTYVKEKLQKAGWVVTYHAADQRDTAYFSMDIDRNDDPTY